VNLDIEADFIGKAALQRIQHEGVSRKQVGLILDTEPLTGPNTSFWQIAHNGTTVGKVTSAIYSPRLEQNIALAMIAVEASELGTALEVTTTARTFAATVVERPFFDPKKSLATG
jgi:glycine cleavage system aminomethyltransferase T